MRPKTIVAGAVLTTAIALVAAPGFAGSRTPAPYEPVPAAAFQALKSDASARSTASITLPDPAYDSAGRLTPDAIFAEPGTAGPAAVPVLKRSVKQPDPKPAKVYKKAKYVLTGKATFYENGTTAMRLPRGTVVVICSDGGCIERVITDYGPTRKGGRLIDLYRPDFFQICGCPGWSGTTEVTVRVY